MILYISLNCKIKYNTLLEKLKSIFIITILMIIKIYSWDLLKTLKSRGTSSKLKSGSISIGLDGNGSTTFAKLKVADTFNEFFITVVDKLVSKLPTAVNISNSNFIHQYYKQKGVVQNSLSLCSVKPKCVKCLKVYHLERLLVLMTYLQDLFVTVPKVLPTLFHTF